MAVEEEVLQAHPDVPGIEALRAAFAAGWLKVRAVDDQAAVAALVDLDRGEAEAIVLMKEMGAAVLLLDERKAWGQAQRQALLVTGTIGILRRAKARGLIPAVYPFVLALRRLGFWVSTELLEQIHREE